MSKRKSPEKKPGIISEKNMPKNKSQKINRKNISENKSPENVAQIFSPKELPINLYGKEKEESKPGEKAVGNNPGLTPTEYVEMLGEAAARANSTDTATIWRYMGALVEERLNEDSARATLTVLPQP